MLTSTSDKLPEESSLVIGASGMLGYGLCSHLTGQGEHGLIGTWRSLPVELPGVEMIHVDLGMDSIAELIRQRRPRVVYHLAWDTSIELCEKDPIRAFHPIEVGLFALVEALNESGGKLVFVSTDSVFSDETEERTEVSLPTPINTYARSKILAEGLIRMMCRDWVIARCCPVGVHPLRERGLVSWLAGQIKREEPVTGFVDSVITPLSVPTLSAMLADCRELHNTHVHLFSDPAISKYDLLCQIVKRVTGDESFVSPGSMADSKLVVPRPHNQALQTTGDFPIRNVASIDDEIDIICDQVRAILNGSTV